jgi:hypothetical protein
MNKPKIGTRDGAGLSQGQASSSQASDKDLFIAVRTELDEIKSQLAVTTPNATDLPTAIALVNAMKVKLNAVAVLVAEFQK